MTTRLSVVSLVILGNAILVAPGCSSLEYKIRESFGQQKRELLVDRVAEAKDSQEDAKVQFVSALEQFKALTGFDGGELETKYDQIKREFDRCNERATDVRKRIDSVEDVGSALFREWVVELEEYTSPQLKAQSEKLMRETRVSYENLISLMRIAESRMEPVLGTFRDQVLFLKHNLNARAIASLGGVSATLQRDIDVLVRDMERAIADATQFIETMKPQTTGGG
jgi:hypothetical protein